MKSKQSGGVCGKIKSQRMVVLTVMVTFLAKRMSLFFLLFGENAKSLVGASKTVCLFFLNPD